MNESNRALKATVGGAYMEMANWLSTLLRLGPSKPIARASIFFQFFPF
jgi:hypothetical protein